jgi:hypothetical protein
VTPLDPGSPRGRYAARLRKELTWHADQAKGYATVAKAVASQLRRVEDGEAPVPLEVCQRADEIVREHAAYRRRIEEEDER